MYRGVTVVNSLEQAYAVAQSPDINIIGGASIFKEAVYSADRIYATEVDFESRDADAFFPELDPLVWHEVSREDHPADELNMYAYSFVVYERTKDFDHSR